MLSSQIQYDDSKHLDVKAPMDGILAEVLVTPGQQVLAGQLLAVLCSAEIGQARAEILKRQKQLEIAGQQLQRESTLAKNLDLLLVALGEGKSIETIESTFNEKVLGGYRQDILSAFSKMRLSQELLTKIEPLIASGSMAGRVMRERELDRQVTESAFRTARDQATFTADQTKLKAQADHEEAER